MLLMMAATPILVLTLLACTTLLLQSATACDGDMCIAVRPCDNAQNIGSLDKKVDELQAALDSLNEQNAGKLGPIYLSIYRYKNIGTLAHNDQTFNCL